MLKQWIAMGSVWVLTMGVPIMGFTNTTWEDQPVQFAQTQTAEQPNQALAGGEFAQNAESAVLMELKTGKILFDKNAEQRREPASITKIMTMALAIEQIQQGELSYNDIVTTSQRAKEMGGTQINLDVGEEMKVYDLLMAIAVASANDASLALAEHIGQGSEAVFIQMMNEKAQELGMKDTVFHNTNGLPANGHLTSAKDIALMSRYLLSMEQAIEFTSTDRYPIRSEENEYMMRNSNALVREYDGCIGTKTGYTQAAGHCVSAAATRGEMTLIAVVLGEPESKIRFAEASALLDYGFDTYTLFTPAVQLEQPNPISVVNGMKEQANVGVNPLQLPPQVIKRGEKPEIKTNVQVESVLNAPIKAGQKVGRVEVTMNGKAIYEQEYTVLNDIQKRTLWNCMMMMLKRTISL